MIQSGTLLVQSGTVLPGSVLLQGDRTTMGWTAVASGGELNCLKAELSAVGWGYFYMDAVKQTVLGSGPQCLTLALQRMREKMRRHKCNSLQIDAIIPYSMLGIPCLSVSAHCCNIQSGVVFAGVQ